MHEGLRKHTISIYPGLEGLGFGFRVWGLVLRVYKGLGFGFRV